MGKLLGSLTVIQASHLLFRIKSHWKANKLLQSVSTLTPLQRSQIIRQVVMRSAVKLDCLSVLFGDKNKSEHTQNYVNHPKLQEICLCTPPSKYTEATWSLSWTWRSMDRPRCMFLVCTLPNKPNLWVFIVCTLPCFVPVLYFQIQAKAGFPKIRHLFRGSRTLLGLRGRGWSHGV